MSLRSCWACFWRVEVGCGEDESGVVGVRECVGEGGCVADVVDIEEEEGGEEVEKRLKRG